MLHCYGLARAYYVYGCYETEIQWTKGSRFPSDGDQGAVNLNNTEFNGITDSQLQLSYNNCIKYYKVKRPILTN